MRLSILCSVLLVFGCDSDPANPNIKPDLSGGGGGGGDMALPANNNGDAIVTYIQVSTSNPATIQLWAHRYSATSNSFATNPSACSAVRPKHWLTHTSSASGPPTSCSSPTDTRSPPTSARSA